MMTRMGDRPFDTLFVDLDGVLRRWPDMADLDLAHDLPAGTLAAAAFAPARPRLGRTARPRSSPTGPR